MIFDPDITRSEKMSVFPMDKTVTLHYRQADYLTDVVISPAETAEFDENSTHFIIVQSGEIEISHDGNVHRLRTGQFGSFPGALSLRGGASALIVTSIGYTGATLIGGPIKQAGRLRYIDGCTSSILISPPVRGEPCLNYLHLPCKTSQTLHTHPTIRVGLILSGNGHCDTNQGLLAFRAGTAFVIPPGVAHSFQSGEENMRIVIYHPDSDSGPTHTDHTMLNRTFVDGNTAKAMTDIHTSSGVQQ